MAETKRERIDTGTDERYIKRDESGRFNSDQVNVGRSSAADQRHQANAKTKPGHGDQGDAPKGS